MILAITLFMFWGSNMHALGPLVNSKCLKVSSNSEPVPFAQLCDSSGIKISETGFNGLLCLDKLPQSHKFIIIASGYNPQIIDSSFIWSDTLWIELTPVTHLLSEKEIVGSLGRNIQKDNPVAVTEIPLRTLKTQAANSFGESVAVLPGIQFRSVCNVCNSSEIRINGMDGPYTSISIDGVPLGAGLASVYGLTGIPVNMIHKAEIVRGPAEVFYGSGSMGGQINLITKQATDMPLLSIESSVSSQNEKMIDFQSGFLKHKSNWTISGQSYHIYNQKDRNMDGFYDLAMQKRNSVLIGWNYKGKFINSNLKNRAFAEERFGGQLNFKPELKGSEQVYGEFIQTRRFEQFGKVNWKSDLNPEVFFGSFLHLQYSYYGTVYFGAVQYNSYVSFSIRKNIQKHHFLSAVQPALQYYSDNRHLTENPVIAKKVFVPGILIQDKYSLNLRTDIQLGFRVDYHPTHGFFYTPRLNLKLVHNNGFTSRFALGSGYRTVQIFTEDHAAMTGSRVVILKENLLPEKCFHGAYQLNSKSFYGNWIAGWDLAVFYTYFNNRIIGDFITNPNQIIYQNLNGYGISKGVSASIDISYMNRLEFLSGLSLNRSYIVDSLLKKNPQLFTPSWTFNNTLTYIIKKDKIWMDLNCQSTGSMMLPLQYNDYRKPKSDPFHIILLKANYQIFENLLISFTGKNLTDFIQKDAIMRPFDPFDQSVQINNPMNWTFDTSYSYAPLNGRYFILSVNWHIDRKKA